MRTGKNTSPADLPPEQVPIKVEPSPLTPEQENLAKLLKRVSDLSSDISEAGEAAYRAAVGELAAAQAAADASVQRNAS